MTPQCWMSFARELATLSTCDRLHVGCVITTDDFSRVLSIGHNGNPEGMSPTCEAEKPGECGDLHAEESAIIRHVGPRHSRKAVFVTHAPCVMCAKRMLHLGGVTAVCYEHDYRDMAGVKMLISARVIVKKVAA